MMAVPPSSPDARQPQEKKSGAHWVVALLLGSFILLVIFVWVLFFSPTGQSRAVTVDFNRVLPATHGDRPQPRKPELHIAVASMISPEHTFEVYGELIQYLGEKLDMQPKIVQRMTYREINDLILNGSIHLGFICTGPYLQAMPTGRMQALVIPVVNGKRYYRAYLIVSRKATYESFEDLRGKTFAFMDPDSLTGFLYPNALLRTMGEDSESFFERTFFVHSHSDLLHAVTFNLADGASVNSLVYDYSQRWGPEETAECRILAASEPLGMPPVVAGPATTPSLKSGIQQVLLNMDEDSSGKEILKRMGIDEFVPADTIRDLYEESRARYFPEPGARSP